MDSLYVPLWLVYDIMSNAILHIIMFHTLATPYITCNLFVQNTLTINT